MSDSNGPGSLPGKDNSLRCHCEGGFCDDREASLWEAIYLLINVKIATRKRTLFRFRSQ
jgi:hypothetical protein